MLQKIRASRAAQLAIAFGIGIAFGFLLERGGVTSYNVIVAQLLLWDFTVVKVMLTAVVVGMVGVYAMKDLGLVTLHPKGGSVGMNVPGGLLFGVGFGLLGYCPGTVVGAVGGGSMDALFGGVPGALLGAALFAAVYPGLGRMLAWGDYGDMTLPRLLKVNHWAVIVPLSLAIIALLAWLGSR